MYVRGYLQGSENGRVVTIAWKLTFQISQGTITPIKERPRLNETRFGPKKSRKLV
jgi:hypothetical protein